MARGGFRKDTSPEDKRFDDLPMIWDRNSILTTIGFFGGSIVVALVACSVLNWLGAGAGKATLLSREEADRLVQEEGCKCRRVRPSYLASANRRSTKEAYVCNCPPSGKRKLDTNPETRSKESGPEEKSAAVGRDTHPSSGAGSPGVKESL